MRIRLDQVRRGPAGETWAEPAIQGVSEGRRRAKGQRLRTGKENWGVCVLGSWAERGDYPSLPRDENTAGPPRWLGEEPGSRGPGCSFSLHLCPLL